MRLFTYLRQPDPFLYNEDFIKKRFYEILKPGKNVISSEGLTGDLFYKSWNSKYIADRIKSLFPNARILIVIRNQYDLLRSLYGHFIREGGAIDLYECLRFDGENFKAIDVDYSIWDHTIHLDTFAFRNLISYYASLFGKNNISVLPMEYIFKDPQFYIQKINNFLQMDVELNHITSEQVHKGYASAQIKVARLLNRFFESHHNRYPVLGIFRNKKKNYGFFHAHRFVRRTLTNKTIAKILGSKKLHDQKLNSAIKKHFDQNNELLDMEYDLLLKHSLKEYYFSRE